MNFKYHLDMSKFTIYCKVFVKQAKNQGVFVKHYAPGGNKVQKAIFSFKVKGHWCEGIISGVCMPNMKSLSHTVQKL